MVCKQENILTIKIIKKNLNGLLGPWEVVSSPSLASFKHRLLRREWRVLDLAF